MKYLIALVIALAILSGFGMLITHFGPGTSAGNITTVAMIVIIGLAVMRVLKRN